MPTRISHYASQQLQNSYLFKLQNRIYDTQTQVTTEKRSQDYMGLGDDTQRLVGYEIDTAMLNNYVRGNDIQDVYFKSSEVALEGALTTISNFSGTLTSTNSSKLTDENAVRALQENAFQSMLSLQSYLNTEVNGQFLFGGAKTNATPVEIGVSSFEAFQERYDGITINYPDSKAKHTENFNYDADGAGRTDWLTFTQDKDGDTTTSGIGTITSTTAQFANVTVGSHIEITGTANNNGFYEVAAVTGGGTTIEIKTKMLTDETTTAGFTKTGGTVFNENVTFNRAAGTIVAATAKALESLTAGSTFTVSGTAQNDGTYTVESTDGTTLKIKETKLTDEGTGATAVGAGLTGQDFTFTNGPETVTAAAGTPFSAYAAGMKITFTGTGSNNTTYTIDSVLGGGSSITVKETVTAEVGAGANDTASVTVATPTLDLVAQSFTFTNNATTPDSIDSGVAGSFSAVKPGMKITFANTVSNDGTYTVASVSADGKSITVLESLFDETPTLSNDTAVVAKADGTVKSVYYYDGDTVERTHRVSHQRSFDLNITAADSAFEKAFRAMGLIAQGKFNTAGGLEQSANADRISEAVALLELSLRHNNIENPQYDPTATSNMQSVFVTLGYQRTISETTSETHKRLAGFFETRIADLENKDKLEAITQLLDDQNALEASYQAISRIRQLNLHNFLS